MRKHNSNRKRGAAIMIVVMFFVVVTIALAAGLSAPVVRDYVTARDFTKSKGAYYLSESGMEDALYRLKNGKTIGAQEVVTLNGSTATTTITSVNSSEKNIGSLGDISTNTRRVKSTLTTSSGASFSYGVQAGAGGVYFQNGSSITGNLYSGGPVCGGGATGATCSGVSGTNIITGTVISSGTTGSNGTIAGIQNQSSSAMYAGTIKNSIVSGAQYCNSHSSNTPNVACQPLSLAAPGDLAITADDVANWENIASSTLPWATCSSGKYTISSSKTIGPKKIPCDLEISGNNTVVTLTGHLWVTGDITIINTPNIKVDPSLTGQSVVIIADNPSNPTNDSKIDIVNNSTYTGATGGNSWVMLLSENTSASHGGSIDAINLENNATGDLLLYARLGNILLQNNAAVKEVTGYKITLQNNANVTYVSGLQNALFTSGPGGSWTIQNWKEGQ